MEFADHSSTVEHKGLVCVGVDRLELGHYALDVVETLEFVACPVYSVASVA